MTLPSVHDTDKRRQAWTECDILEAMPFTTINHGPANRQTPGGRRRYPRRTILAIIVLALAAATALYLFGSRHSEQKNQATTLRPPTSTSQNKERQSVSSQAEEQQHSDFDKRRYSLDDPNSPWVIVNKRRPLQPKDFTPDVVTPNVPLRLSAGSTEMMVSRQVAPQLEAMFAAAKSAGLNLMVASAYRPYSMQVAVYDNEVRTNGQAVADRQSARPGHSEHQTGLAVDVEPTSRECEILDCFGDTPEGKWVTEHAHEYGFILRYTASGEAVSGYRHETWHFRYVGAELAKEIYRLDNPPLETFFGLPPAPDYQ